MKSSGLTQEVNDEARRSLGRQVVHQVNIVAWLDLVVDFNAIKDQRHILHQVQGPQDVLPQVCVLAAHTEDRVAFLLHL